MNLSLIEIPDAEKESVIVRCHSREEKWVKNIFSVCAGQVEITATSEKKVFRLKLDDIFYFEVVDGHSFVYSRSAVFECRQKLYEFEELSRNSSLFRCSKSVVLNADKIQFIRPTVSGRFEATLQNEHRVIISRQYVPELKRILGL